MSPFEILAVSTTALGTIWALLSGGLIVDRTLFDRARTQAVRDAQDVGAPFGRPAEFSRRRLRRIALGTYCDAAVVAACELERRDRDRLRLTATTGGRRARLAALTVLVRGRDITAAALVRTELEKGDVDSATALLRIAGELPVHDADAVLLDALLSGRVLRSRVATELEPRTARLRGRLIDLSASPDPELAYWAITLLRREMDYAPAAKVVVAHAADESANVRAAVAEALGFGPFETAAPVLRRLLADDVFYVRSHAARAVAQSGAEDLAEDLLPLLADRNWWVRAAAKESLTSLGRPGLRVAMTALSHADPFARDGGLEVIAATELLVGLDGSEHTEVMRQALAVAEVA